LHFLCPGQVVFGEVKIPFERNGPPTGLDGLVPAFHGRGARDQSKPRRAKGVRDQASGMPAGLCYLTPLATLICRASWVAGVVFETAELIRDQF
jgi:hypothetical protein